VSQKLLPFFAHLNKNDLIAIQQLLGSGKVAPVIDRSYSLSDVPQAIRYLEGGHARGKIVIRVEDRGEK
jgi:NADPH:quinone reductase-like Zn-dependent oxidoreductase